MLKGLKTPIIYEFSYKMGVFNEKRCKKIKKYKINFDGLTFSSSLWLVKK